MICDSPRAAARKISPWRRLLAWLAHSGRGSRSAGQTNSALHFLQVATQELLHRLSHIQAFIDSGEDCGKEWPFFWMRKYKAVLFEQKPKQALPKIQQALKAVARRKDVLMGGPMDIAEWNLLQFAEIVLHRIERDGGAPEFGKIHRRPEVSLWERKKVA